MPRSVAGQAGAVQYEDALHASGDVGVMMLAVRNDADATLTDVDLDYIPVSADETGRLKSAPVEGITYFDPAAALVDVPLANVAAVVTVAAVPGFRHYLKSFAWSYSAAPAAGSTMIVTDGGVQMFHQYVSAAGPGFQEFPGDRGLRMAANSALVLTLLAGGLGVLGSVSIKGIVTLAA